MMATAPTSVDSAPAIESETGAAVEFRSRVRPISNGVRLLLHVLIVVFWILSMLFGIVPLQFGPMLVMISMGGLIVFAAIQKRRASALISFTSTGDITWTVNKVPVRIPIPCLESFDLFRKGRLFFLCFNLKDGTHLMWETHSKYVDVGPVLRHLLTLCIPHRPRVAEYLADANARIPLPPTDLLGTAFQNFIWPGSGYLSLRRNSSALIALATCGACIIFSFINAAYENNGLWIFSLLGYALVLIFTACESVISELERQRKYRYGSGLTDEDEDSFNIASFAGH